MSKSDPFTGTWVYRPEQSKSTGPKLQRWVQWIDATSDDVSVREEVAVATRQLAHVTLQAKFDGKDYPVTGSSLADTIAYTRASRREIAGTGKKNGSVTLRETIVAGEDGDTLTLTYTIFSGEHEVMNGVAVFERDSAPQRATEDNHAADIRDAAIRPEHDDI